MTDAVGKEILIEGADPRELRAAECLPRPDEIASPPAQDRRAGLFAQSPRFRSRDAAFRGTHGGAGGLFKYGHISSQVIDQCFAGGIAAQEAPVDKDVIVYGNNGLRRPGAHGQPAQRLVNLYDRNDLLFAVGPGRVGQDLWGDCAGGAGAEGDREVRRIILTRPGGGSGREAGFPARRHEGEARSLPAAAVRCAERHDSGLRSLASTLEERHGADRAAGLHARPHARQRLRHPGRSAEHDAPRRSRCS